MNQRTSQSSYHDIRRRTLNRTRSGNPYSKRFCDLATFYTFHGEPFIKLTLILVATRCTSHLVFTRIKLMLISSRPSKNLDLRRGLLLNTWHNAGTAFSDYKTPERKQLMDKVTQLLSQCIRDTSIEQALDAAVDQIAKKYQRKALPHDVVPEERARTIFGSKTKTDRNGDCLCEYDINLSLRANIV